MVIITCRTAPTPASQLQENIKPAMMSAGSWQVTALSSLPKKTLQMNSKLYAGPAQPLSCQTTRRALYSLHGCLPRRCQPRVRVRARTNGKLVGATKQAVRKILRLGEEPEPNVSLSHVHFKVSEKDLLREKGLSKRDDASSSRTHDCGKKKKKRRYGVCIHSSIFLHLSFEEETG